MKGGEIQNMGIDKVEALSRVLRCSPGYLMGWEDTANPSSDKQEELLLNTYRKLNRDGRRRLLERTEELFELGYVEKRGRRKNGVKYRFKEKGNIIELKFEK